MADASNSRAPEEVNEEESKDDQRMGDERETERRVVSPRNYPERQRGSSGRRREEFYLRYYVGHKGKFGHEFLEFEFQQDGRLRYANNSQYKAENLIRKEVYVNGLVIEELKRII